MDYGDHTVIVLASYGLAALVILGLSLRIWLGRRSK